MKTKTDKAKGFDKPIQKPFEELPEWFMRNLRSRLVTKKMVRQDNGDTGGYEHRQPRQNRQSGSI